jgi:hypothetical protein
MPALCCVLILALWLGMWGTAAPSACWLPVFHAAWLGVLAH